MKKFVAWLLVAIMVVSSLPVAAFAEAGEGTTEPAPVTCPGAEHAGEHKSDAGYRWDKIDEEIAGCGKNGYTVYKCLECGVQFVDNIKVMTQPHEIEVVEPMVQATCVAEGTVATIKCINDGCALNNPTKADKAGLDTSALVGLLPDTMTNIRAAHKEATTDVKSGDCINGYKITYTCSICNVSYEEKGSASDDGSHVWKYLETVKAPTCTEDGIAKVECTAEGCNEVQGEIVIAKLGHKPSDVIAEDPAVCKDNLDDGFKAHRYCLACSTKDYKVYLDANKDEVVTYESLVIPAAHDYGQNGFVVTGGDCTTEPTVTRLCTLCDNAIKQNISDYIAAEEAAGKDLYLDNAGKYYMHEWTVSATEAPDCGHKGYKIFICNRTDCEESYMQVINKIPTHTTATKPEDATLVAATCKADAYYYWTCTGCNTTVTQTNEGTMLDHNASLVTVTVPATCQANGYKFTYCANGGQCGIAGETPKTQWTVDTVNYPLFTVDAEGKKNGDGCYLVEFNGVTPSDLEKEEHHDWVDVKHVAPTCYVNGSISRFCQLCGKEETNKPLTRVHEMVDNGYHYQTHAMATAGNENYGHSMKCSHEDCPYVTYDKAEAYKYPAEEHFGSYEAIHNFHPDAPGQNNEAWKQIYPAAGANIPECTVQPIYQAECECGVIISYKGLQVDHSYNGKIEVERGEVAPIHQTTCDGDKAEDGFELCDICGVERKTTEAAKATVTGHQYVIINDTDADDTNNSKLPTCTEKGWTTGTYCSNCDYTSDGFKWLDPINHANAYDVEAKDATCTADGNEAYYYCPDCKSYKETKEAEGWSSDNTFVISKLEHKDEKVIDSSTVGCLTEAYELWYCPACKNNLHVKGYQAALGHDYDLKGAPTGTEKPDCDSEGYDYWTCGRCQYDHKVVYKDALGHVNAAGDRLETTCTVNYPKDRICETCGDEIKVNHPSWNETLVEATCVSPSYTLKYCTNCGEYDQKTLTDSLGEKLDPKLYDSHDWKDADVQETGWHNEVCKLCGETWNTPIEDKDTKIEYIIKAENADVADGDYAQGSIVKVTLSIKSEYANLNALHVTMKYDEDKVDFLRAEYGETINPNFTLLAMAHGANGVVSYSSLVEGGRNYTLTSEETLAIFYFRIHGSTYAPNTETFSVEKNDTTFAIDYSKEKKATEALDAEAKPVAITECDDVKVEYTMLTDANADGGLGIADVQYIFSILKGDYEGACDTYAKGYRAAADVNMDGVITFDDARIILHRVNNMTTDWDIFADICA